MKKKSSQHQRCPLLRVILCIVFSAVFVFELPADEKSPSKKLALPVPETLSDSSEDEATITTNLAGKTVEELEDLRAPRKLLLDYLLEEKKIRETPKGTIEYLDYLNHIARNAVREENHTRTALFTLIARQDKKAIAAVGREFHEKLSEKPSSKPKPEPPAVEVSSSLRVSAPLSLGRDLASKLIYGYLHSLGYTDVKIKIIGEVTRFVGKRSFGNGVLAVDLTTYNPLTAKDPQESTVMFETARMGGEVPTNTIALESLAIVVHPENPASFLTISQVADIFSGKTREWSKIRSTATGEIALLPEARPDLVDQFRDIVLKPNDKSLREEAVQMDANYLEQLTSNPNAIAFCHPSEITAQIKALKIQGASKSIPLVPSTINILALDYPLQRCIRLRATGSSNSFVSEFINYTQSAAGQSAIAALDYLCSATTDDPGTVLPEIHRQSLLVDPEVPESYKTFIINADRLNSPANFRFNPGADFVLTDYSLANLERLINYLLSNRDQGWKIKLIGFSDNQSDNKANLIYSKKRADSIAEKLQSRGITQVETAGVGSVIPIGDNSTENGRMLNRRVEVWIER
jgi:phosphate transport system substrate-binding protein